MCPLVLKCVEKNFLWNQIVVFSTLKFLEEMNFEVPWLDLPKIGNKGNECTISSGHGGMC